MAKVKIQGHASGTGILTVTAPNTSTDRTITLPDSTDTLIGAATTDALTTRINAAGGRKNIIINGAMKVWQRSTSQAAVTATYNTLDRWYTTITAGGVWTQSKATGTAGFASAIKMDCTTADASLAAGDRLMLSYNIEGQDLQHLKKGTASAESVTLSFWVKSPKTGTHIIELYDHDNSRHICQAYTVSSADTWEQKTLTFAGDTTGAFGDDANNSCTIQFYMAAGSTYTSGTLATSWAASSNANRAVGQVNCADSTSNDFYLTGVQLELGTAATDYEHRSYGEELALCQRYYCQYTSNAASSADDAFANVVFWNNDGGYWAGYIYFPCTMRVAPTFTSSAVDTFNLHQAGVFLREPSTMLMQSGNIFGARIHGAVSYTETNGLAGQLCADGTDTCYLNFDSEL